MASVFSRRFNPFVAAQQEKENSSGTGGQASGSEFAVVGIGASAGGLDAFKRFFEAMPDQHGMAFILVSHLDPSHSSMLADLLGRSTSMPVVQIEDQMRVRPDHVYVIPPNKYLTISGLTLNLSPPIEQRGIRLPIDFFLRSLAEDIQERGIAIILSGTGSDGNHGVREIKASGGMVMVQEPASAEFDSMPRSAIETDVVDHVLPVEHMPGVLIQFVEHWYVRGGQSPPSEAEQNDDLTRILALLRARMKYDFTSYKKGTLTRRVQRRMGLRHLNSAAAYVELLRENKDEVTALFKDLLIGVTSFFREPEAWQALQELVLTPLIEQQPYDRAIRIWVPGCATGEEPYSLAMLLVEQMEQLDKRCDINIFASDIDTDALSIARAGVYPESIAADVTPERLSRFFHKGEHTYRIIKEIRDSVVFAEQNLVSDPPFSKLDLICCRNLLIYIESDIQKRVLSLFHFGLYDSGSLFLGNAETVSGKTELFHPLSRKWRIYRHVGPVRLQPLDLSMQTVNAKRPSPDSPSIGDDQLHRRLANVAQQILVQRYAPACVLVSRNGKVLYTNGPVDNYLQLPAGELAADLYAMARPGLRTKLRTALRQAAASNELITIPEARVKRGNKYVSVEFEVEPLRTPVTAEGLLLVAFHEADSKQSRVRVVYVEPTATELPEKPSTVAECEVVIRHLEGELHDTREDLQTTIEELETSNEEYKATNEEATSVNEELQSTNEELETSKEELQSMNEELETVNSQLEAKIDELEALNNDLHNLLESIDYPTLFLDRQLRIKRFTPATTSLLPIIDSDVGRPLRDFVKNIEDPTLLTDAKKVLKNLTAVETEIKANGNQWYLRRIMPYRTSDNRIDGVVVVFSDTTHRKLREEAQRRLKEDLEYLVAKRTDVLQLVHDVTATANRAETVEEAARSAIDRICSFHGIDAGCVYTLSPDGRTLEPTGWCHSNRAAGELESLCETLATVSVATSKALWITDAARLGRLQWVTDLANVQIQNQILDIAKEAGLQSSGAIPIMAERSPTAVLVCFSKKKFEPDPKLLQALEGIGMQVGQVVHRKRLEKQLVESTDLEQTRFGRELHDSIGQNLSAIGMMASAVLAESTAIDSPARDRVSALVTLIEKSNAQLRALVTGLMAVELATTDLVGGLQAMADHVDMTYGISCTFDFDPSSRPTWISDAFTTSQIYRITQEAVHNAVKHSAAKNIEIRLLDGKQNGITVVDDGIGISISDEDTHGHGITIMRYRATLIGADLRVERGRKGGTVITCAFKTAKPPMGVI